MFSVACNVLLVYKWGTVYNMSVVSERMLYRCRVQWLVNAVACVTECHVDMCCSDWVDIRREASKSSERTGGEAERRSSSKAGWTARENWWEKVGVIFCSPRLPSFVTAVCLLFFPLPLVLVAHTLHVMLPELSTVLAAVVLPYYGSALWMKVHKVAGHWSPQWGCKNPFVRDFNEFWQVFLSNSHNIILIFKYFCFS